MKMKNMLIGGMSLALVACISVGATLAYLTATTREVTNKFTFTNNGITLTLSETARDGVGYDIDKTEAEAGETITYSNIVPGATLVKKPVLTVGQGSLDCYVYAHVTGIDDTAASGTATTPNAWTTWGTNWEEVEGYTGKGTEGVLLKYTVKVPATETASNKKDLPDIFSEVHINPNLTGTVMFDNIVIEGYSIQADAVDADAQAIAHFTENLQG